MNLVKIIMLAQDKLSLNIDKLSCSRHIPNFEEKFESLLDFIRGALEDLM